MAKRGKNAKSKLPDAEKMIEFTRRLLNVSKGEVDKLRHTKRKPKRHR